MSPLPRLLLGLTLLFVAMSTAPHVAAQTPPATANAPLVEANGPNPLDGPFLGLGVEWDIHAYSKYGIDTSDFKLIEQRLRWMRPSLVRAMMLANYCYLGNGRYDWDSEPMRYLYRQLDLCQSLGITVLLTEWGLNDNWLRTPDVKRVDDPKYAEIIRAYLDHLVNEKKYTCIRYFIFCNEPGQPAKRAEWLAGLANVAAELKKRGLDQRIRLASPDQSGNTYDLVPETVQRIGPALGAFDLHYYVNGHRLVPTTQQAAQSGEIRRFFTEAWQTARRLDPDRTKPLLIGEAGYWSHEPEVEKHASASHNAWHQDWRYGLWMAQYAAQAIDAGTWGISFWMLDDDSHINFDWGLWRNKTQGFTLKPVAHVWALLSRSFPANATFARVINRPAGLEILAAKLPSQNQWSVCLVNCGSDEIRIRLRLPNAGRAETARYLYTEKNVTPIMTEWLKPTAFLTANWDDGEPITCPPGSVTFLLPASLALE